MSTTPLGSKSPGHAADISKPLTSQIHDASADPSVTRVGTWTDTSDVRAWEGSYTQSTTTNDTISLTYLGTTVWVRWRADTSSGKAQVQIVDKTLGSPTNGQVVDGPSTVDLYSSPAGYVFTLFGTNLSRGTYQIVITVTGTKNASSSANTIKVDGFSSDIERGHHQVLAFSEETLPTVISGGIPFLLMLFPIAASSMLLMWSHLIN